MKKRFALGLPSLGLPSLGLASLVFSALLLPGSVGLGQLIRSENWNSANVTSGQTADDVFPMATGTDLWARFDGPPDENKEKTVTNGSAADTGGNSYGFIEAGAASDWFAGQRFQFEHTLPATASLADLSLTAKMRTNDSTLIPAEFRIESLSGTVITGFVEFAPQVNDAAFQSVGGLLSSGTNSTFDLTASKFQIVFAFNDDEFGMDTGNELFFDDLNYSIVPEPAAWLMLVLVGICAVASKAYRGSVAKVSKL